MSKDKEKITSKDLISKEEVEILEKDKLGLKDFISKEEVEILELIHEVFEKFKKYTGSDELSINKVTEFTMGIHSLQRMVLSVIGYRIYYLKTKEEKE